MHHSRRGTHTSVRARAGRAALLATCLLPLVSLAVGCAKAEPAIGPDGPPLAMPVPPPRVLAPVVEEPVAAAAPPPPEEPVPPVAAPPRTPPRPAPRRPTDTDAKPAEPPAPAPTPPVAAAPADALREPRGALTPSEAAHDKRIRDILLKSSRDLTGVDYRKLTTEGRSQYEQSKRFAEQADEELKKRNYPFAETLADKAATLAAALSGR